MVRKPNASATPIVFGTSRKDGSHPVIASASKQKIKHTNKLIGFATSIFLNMPSDLFGSN